MNTRSPKPAVDLRGALSAARAVEAALDPLVAVLWLIAMLVTLRLQVDAVAVIAVVIVFGLTFPGNVRLTDGIARVAAKSLMTAATVLAGLTLLGLAGGWFDRLSRPALLPWLAGLPAALLGAQLLSRAILLRVFSFSQSQASVVVCGTNEIGMALANQFRSNPFHGVHFLGFFDDRNRERREQEGAAPMLGSFDELGDYVRQYHVDRIYLALPMASQPRILKILDDLKDSTASIYFVPDIFVTEIINGRFASVAGIPVVAVRDTPFASVVNSAVKRAEDIVLSSIALVMLAPVLAAIAIAVRVTSPGPAIFRQRRYGLDGRDIVVYKFRTMSVIEDGASIFTAVKKGDSRVTPLGHVLRRNSLDELPQFFNVLQGRMSLVGPRPHAVAMNEQFRKLIPGYMLRHKIKPGITGLAQVRGFRGGDDLEEMSKRISSDLEYLRKWTLVLDLGILVRTVIMVLWDRKAY